MNELKKAQDGVFTNLRNLRTLPYKSNRTDREMIGIIPIGNLFYADNSDGFTEVVNNKLELLGVIFYYNEWKKYVWEQYPETIMDKKCLSRIIEIIQIKSQTQAKS